MWRYRGLWKRWLRRSLFSKRRWVFLSKHQTWSSCFHVTHVTKTPANLDAGADCFVAWCPSAVILIMTGSACQI